MTYLRPITSYYVNVKYQCIYHLQFIAHNHPKVNESSIKARRWYLISWFLKYYILFLTSTWRRLRGRNMVSNSLKQLWKRLLIVKSLMLYLKSLISVAVHCMTNRKGGKTGKLSQARSKTKVWCGERRVQKRQLCSIWNTFPVLAK